MRYRLVMVQDNEPYEHSSCLACDRDLKQGTVVPFGASEEEREFIRAVRIAFEGLYGRHIRHDEGSV